MFDPFKTVQIVVAVEDEWESDLVVDFNHLESGPVQGESIQLDGKDLREALQLESFDSIYLFGASLALILVVFVQFLRPHKALQGHFEGSIGRTKGRILRVILDGQGQIKEFISVLRFVAALLTANITHKLALIQFTKGRALFPSNRKALLDCIE